MGVNVKSSSDKHKNNPGDYIVTFYCPVGRKRGYRLKDNLSNSQKLADRWARMSGGSAVVHRCLYNTTVSRAKWMVNSK